MASDLIDRLFSFSISIIQLIRKLPEATEYKVIKYQIARSGTSAGANYEGAQAGSSKRDFAHKIKICLSEMRETNYWLRILKSICGEDNIGIQALIEESDELKKILGTILNKLRG